MAKLQVGMNSLATGSTLCKDMSPLHPGLRMMRCEHHYIFCLPRDEAPALVVAILHERMNLMMRLADRLKEPLWTTGR